jgi:DNA-directed RNA polymerase specialized sigma24 family protein
MQQQNGVHQTDTHFRGARQPQKSGPTLAAEVAEQCQHLLRSLCDKELQEVALARMEGYSVEEIAGRLDCSPRSVKRRLRLIRSLWQKESGP